MVAGKSVQFGHFGLLPATGQLFAGRPHAETADVQWTDEMYRATVRAFEEVRQPPEAPDVKLAPDHILWNASLAQRLYRRARELGVSAPDAEIGKRLLHVRKTPQLRGRLGLEILPSVGTVPRHSIVPRYAHAVEFALVQLRYRYGSSIDDILLDQGLATEFEELARRIVPRLKSTDLRLAALYIRKTRYLGKRDRTLFDELDADGFEQSLVSVGTIGDVDLRTVPASKGLVEVCEPDRHLYIGRHGDLRSFIKELRSGRPFSALANEFWHPRQEEISLRVYGGDSFQGTSLLSWQLKLISKNYPVFNWPVRPAAA